MKFLIGTTAVVLALALGACGGDDAATSAEKKDPRFATITGLDGKELRIKPSHLPPPKKVLKRDLKEGSGPIARRGDWVAIYYLGVNYKTGKEQYGRWPPDEPLHRKWGYSEDGVGWEEGIKGMREGDVRELIVPSHLLYENGTIDYVVELARVNKPDPERKLPPKPRIDPPDGPPPKQVVKRDIRIGSGPAARRGDVVTLRYVGVSYKTGEVIYDHWPPVEPLERQLGLGGQEDPWEEGIEGMKVGGRRELIIPSRLLYKEETLDYVVELIGLDPAE